MFIDKLLLVKNIMNAQATNITKYSKTKKNFLFFASYFARKDLNSQSISLRGIEQDYNQTILYLYKSGENG